jgi:hypothetical protein
LVFSFSTRWRPASEHINEPLADLYISEYSLAETPTKHTLARCERMLKKWFGQETNHGETIQSKIKLNRKAELSLSFMPFCKECKNSSIVLFSFIWWSNLIFIQYIYIAATK